MKIILSLNIALLLSISALADNGSHDKIISKNTITKFENSLNGSGISVTDSTAKMKSVLGNAESKEWYVGMSLGHARMKDDQGTFIMGFQGGRILNQRFVIGAAGYGFMNGEGQNNHNDFSGIRGGYGGLLVAPIFWGKRTVHLSIPLILGGGAISNSMGDFKNSAVNSGFFVFVPGVELEMSITKHFRISATFNYRITSGLKWNDMSPDFESPGSNYVNGPSINLNLKFGNFITKKWNDKNNTCITDSTKIDSVTSQHESHVHEYGTIGDTHDKQMEQDDGGAHKH